MPTQVDSWIEMQEAPYNTIAEVLRKTILETVPGVIEKYSFKIPFYHYYGMFCYLNKTKTGIELCFCRGKDLVDAWPQLKTNERAMVAGISFNSMTDLKKHSIRSLIAGAAAWQEEAARLKISMIRKNKK